MTRVRARERWAVVLVATLLGLMGVAQLRGQSGVPTLSGLSSQELTVLIANLDARNEQLRAEVATLDRQVAALEAAHARGDSAVGALRADLLTVGVFAGLVGAAGPGVTVSITGPIGADGLSDLVNELRNGGAEAISIEGLRLTAGVVATGLPGDLVLGGHELGEPIVIDAIGNAPVLAGTLTRVGGIVAQLGAAYPDATIVVAESDRLVVPATTLDLRPTHGRPRL